MTILDIGILAVIAAAVAAALFQLKKGACGRSHGNRGQCRKRRR